jgi:hypothetical protein
VNLGAPSPEYIRLRLGPGRALKCERPAFVPGVAHALQPYREQHLMERNGPSGYDASRGRNHPKP